MTMGKTLYIGEQTPCTRSVLMTIAALGIDIETKEVDVVDKQEQNSDWFHQINPMHCVPTLVEEDGWALWQSRSIMRHLADQHASDDHLYPKDLRLRSQVNKMLDYNASRFAVLTGRLQASLKFNQGELDPVMKRVMSEQLDDLDRLPSMRAGHFLFGDHLTLADISLIANLSYLESLNFSIADYEHVTRWAEMMKSQDFYIRCQAS